MNSPLAPQTEVKKAQINQCNFPKSLLIASRNELTDLPLEIEGTMPVDLQGYLFIMGSAGSVDSEYVEPNKKWVASSHENGISIFNGDGFICRLNLTGDQQVLATTRLVKMPCYHLDEALYQNSELQQEFGFHSVGLMRFSPRLGMRTQANTACLPIHFSQDSTERLLLTSDTGRPFEIDPVTLEVLTPIGWNHEWKEIKMPIVNGPLKMVGSAAHPVFDTNTDEFFTVNWSKSMETMLSPTGLSFQGLEELVEKLPAFLRKKYRNIKLLRFLNRLPLIGDLTCLLYSNFFSRAEISEILKSVIAERNLTSVLQNIESQILMTPLSKLEDLLQSLLSMLKDASSILGRTQAMEDFVYLIKWDGGNALQSWKVLIVEDGELKPVKLSNSLHQIGLTKDYIVLMDTTFKVGLNQVFGKNFPAWEAFLKILREGASHPQSSSATIYLVKRSDLAHESQQDPSGEAVVVASQVVLPSETAHFAVDYDDSNHKITVHTAHNCAWDPAEWIQPYDHLLQGSSQPPVGFSIGSMDVNKLGKYIIDAEKAVIEESVMTSDAQLTWATAIFTHPPISKAGKIKNIYWNSWGLWEELKTGFALKLYQNYESRNVSLEAVLSQTFPASLIRLNTETMKIEDSYQFPSGFFGNSPQFIPRKQACNSEEGYITSVVFHDTDLGELVTEIWVFDATKLNDGPMCKLRHPAFKLGVTIHSTWMLDIQPSQSNYRIPMRQDYAAYLCQESSTVRQLFENHVFSKFK